MHDAVIDVTVVAFANGPIRPEITGALARCLPVIIRIVDGQWRCRYNTTLINKYREIIQIRRNDFVEAFLDILVTPRAVRARNNLRHHEYARARDIGWPTHDHHLLAAAIDGVNPTIVVTENTLALLRAPAKRVFGISVQQV